MICGVVLLHLVAREGDAAYFSLDPKTQWEVPILNPWDPMRSTKTSITMSWTTAWNRMAAVGGYELEMRRPKGPTKRFGDFENLRNQNEETPTNDGAGKTETMCKR